MAQQVPPPPPGFQIVGGPASAPTAPRPRKGPSAPRYNGPMPSNAEALFPALIRQESGGQAGILGPQTRYGQAIGRTQMLPDTAREVAQKIGVPYREDLLRGTSSEAAQYQDQLGMAYLQEGFERTGNARDALHYYHGGPNRALWGPKTRSYADSILAMTAQGQGEAPAFDAAQPTAGSVPPPPAGFQIVGSPSAAQSAAPIEVEIDEGVQNIDGRAVLAGQDMGPWDAYQANQRRSQSDRMARVEREDDPAYQAEYAAALGRSENVPAWIENLTQGGTLGAVPLIEGALGWLDPNVEGIDRGLASQAARDASRDRQAKLLADDPVGTIGMQLAGGLLTPGLRGTGDWIGAASGAQRAGRAATVGAGYGAVAGAIGAEGGAGERVQGGLLGGGIGAATGGLLDAGMQRAFSGAARRVENPSPARLLSREGVTLTPGQMLENTPVVGGMIRGVEDAASSIPLAGSAIAGARNEGIETFNRAALNRALAPIGESLPRNTRPGYGAVEDVQRRLGEAYDRILPNVSARLDQPLFDDIAKVLDSATAEMQPDQVKQLAQVLQNRVFRNFETSDAPITGDEFKRIESELGALARQYNTALDPTHQAFGSHVQDLRTAVRDMIARQNPEEARRIAQINEGYANLVRVEKAAGSGPAEAADGVFTPTQLGIAARHGASRSTRATGDGLLRDLASAGRQLLPSKVGDSGTAMRGAVTAIVGGGAAGLLSPQLAVPVIAVAGLYSKPAQAALNAIYRATDQQTAFSALGELQRFAARNPALQPYYQAAVEAVQQSFGSQSPATEPGAGGLLSPTAPIPTAP